MHDAFFPRLLKWNDRLCGIPRKGALVAVTFLVSALFFVLLPYCWPFVLAFLFSRMLEPFVRVASKGFRRVRLGRPAASALGVLLLFGIVGALVSALVGRLIQELTGFVRTLPQTITWISETGVSELKALYARYREVLPAYLPEMLENALTALGQNALRWAGTLSAALTSGAWSTATSIPHALLSVVLTVMGTYYMTADRARIAAFFHRTLPPGLMRHGRFLRTRLWGALLGQIRSQLTVSLVITAFLMAMLAAFRIRYGLVIGLLIGVADALPVLGAGLFLIPWSLAAFIGGQTGTGVLMACLYVGTIVIRQVLEPRIVGKNLGLYPLATMAAMYAGYRLMGFVGLLAGPVLLNVVKVILEADERARAAIPNPPE